MSGNLKEQNRELKAKFSHNDLRRWDHHFTDDKLTRYVRDRRLNVGLNYLKSKYSTRDLENWKVLIICGSVGGEGVYFIKAGFKDVTLSDINQDYLGMAKILAPQLKTIFLNGEALELESDAYDLVVVQDGLHHLRRPSTGFTEMLRVAKKAVIVIDGYDSFIGRVLGTEWEWEKNDVNYVYRWTRKMIEQTAKSYLLQEYDSIKVFRLWDHNLTILRLVRKLKFPKLKLSAAKAIYSFLSLINFSGNMMVAVVTKKF